VLGAKLLEAREVTANIPLITPGVDKNNLVVIRYQDTGDRVFNPALDKPLSDSDTGDILITSVQ
jgi:hypothetical protein